MATKTILAVGKITPRQKTIYAHVTEMCDVQSVNDFLEASITPPPTREERVDEAVWQVQTEAYYRWVKAETEDLVEGRLDEEFNRWGC